MVISFCENWEVSQQQEQQQSQSCRSTILAGTNLPGDIEHVRLRDGLLQSLEHGLLHAARLHKLHDVLRHLEVERRDVAQLDPLVHGEDPGEGVHGPAVLEVADHGDGEVLDGADLAPGGGFNRGKL